MWEETKLAIKKTIWICQTLLTLSDSDYERLINITAEIEHPKIDDPELIINKLKILYSEAAESIGLDGVYGLAVLEYICLLKEMDDS